MHSPGGGMYVHGASPSVHNCLFLGNETGSKGDYYSENGAGVAVSIGFPHFVNCLFLGNTTAGHGRRHVLREFQRSHTDELPL